MLTAQIERCILRRPGSINGYSPVEVGACRMLHGFGFYKHLKFNTPRLIDPDAHPEDAITIRSGVGASSGMSENLEVVARVALPVFNDEAFVEKLHATLNEAMTNIVGHAYNAEPNSVPYANRAHFDNLQLPLARSGVVTIPQLQHRWWFAGTANDSDPQIHICALDHGTGVPAVAPFTMSSALEEFWAANPRKDPSRNPTDAEVLEAVARARREGFGTGRRGQGFPNMIGLVEDAAARGSVTVLSGEALYEFRLLGPNSAKLERCFALRNRFAGTVVEWDISGPRSPREGGQHD